MYYQKKVKAIPAKGLTKDLIINLMFLMTHNTCIQEYYKIILCLYQLQNTFNIFMTNIQIYLWKFNGRTEESIENITISDCNFASTFVDHYVLPDINFNRQC